MPDIYITLSELEAVSSNLGDIVEEFEQATSRADDLETAIGDPFGRNELREQAEEFEDRWDNKRDELKDSLKEVKKHVDGVVETINGWDSETAVQLSSVETKITASAQ